jgi:hypothetical protein
MKHKKVILLSALVILILAGIATGLLLAFYHEPGFYRRALIPPGPERTATSQQCFGRLTTEVGNNIINAGTQEYNTPWRFSYTETEINSFLQEDFFQNWPDAKSLAKQGISDARVTFEDDHFRLGFRYGTKPWQTVMSFDMRVRLVPREVNVLTIELVSRHAGALPASAQSLLTTIAEQLHNEHVEINWYRHNGNPVALVRFRTDGTRPNFQLREVAFRQGLFIIAGAPLETVAQAGR